MTTVTPQAAALAAIVATIGLAAVVPPLAPIADQALPIDAGPEVLNVVGGLRAPDILSEMLGLGEDDVVVEWVEHFSVEWIVRGADPTVRRARFEAGLIAIAERLLADRTLGGVARSLTIGPPDRRNHKLAEAPATLAALVPVRVVLRGRSLIA